MTSYPLLSASASSAFVAITVCNILTIFQTTNLSQRVYWPNFSSFWFVSWEMGIEVEEKMKKSKLNWPTPDEPQSLSKIKLATKI